MPSENLYNLISLDEYSATPKYLQVVNSIVKAIEDGKISKGYLMPSSNDLSYELDISRDTSMRIYKELKKLKILVAFPGKGYFISETDLRKRITIFLLFNKLSTHKKIIYDSFAAALGNHAAIDFYIYNNDFLLFKDLLNNRKKDYSYYVIIPHFLEGGEHATDVINTIPKEKLIIMDKLLPGVDGSYGAVYENFEKDIYTSLKQALPQLSKYHTINIIFLNTRIMQKRFYKAFTIFAMIMHSIKKLFPTFTKKRSKKVKST